MPKKKKKSTRKKLLFLATPQHSLPSGFWAQVGAVFLVVLSALLIVAWFDVGGPVLEWINSSAQQLIGYGVYVLPILLVYVAVEIFRAEENRLPLVMRFAVLLEIVWLSGLFGLLKTTTRPLAGGAIGDLTNAGMLGLVDAPVAAFVYVLLIFVTALFITRTSPFTIIRLVWEWIRRDTSEDEENQAVMRKSAKADTPKPAKAACAEGIIKLNAGVPTIDAEPEPEPKNLRKLSSLRNSVKSDKTAEEQSALVSVHDPNWEAPSLELLEKKQSATDAGDIRQNAQIIHDTLAEFNIDVEMEDANIGPKVTQYTLRPPSGVKLTYPLETNIALNLAAQGLRIEAPIPGQKAVGIEVPNRKATLDVRLFGVLNSKQWKGNPGNR